MSREFDVVVVGGGHAGCEAAAAAARYGARTLLLTHRCATIGEMSCNPAIGGIGKGHIVREIDALDGLMARAIDRAGIQFKMLNRSKGPAVQGPRAQADRSLYRAAIQSLLGETTNLVILEGEVEDISLGTHGDLQGVRCADGRLIECGAAVLTTGTFLRGRIHIGAWSESAGRMGEAAAPGLSTTFQRLGLTLGRLKTGTPPRLHRDSLDWDDLPADPGDPDPEPFSTMTGRIETQQIACRITQTNDRSHALIRDNLSHSAVYGGHISGIGPRYCPSIEDKVVRFAGREHHQVFLEPEGLDDPTVYPNGISTSLPEPVQLALVRSMEGCGRAVILRPGYAVEYDYLDPRGLLPSLEVRAVPGLFLAGQINGTTGYEEAAGQGLMAGLNAARRCAGAAAAVLDRGDGYIGVMIDDLTTQGVTEPYRMFTSRAEFRLTLRADNADLRLTGKGSSWGIVRAERQSAFACYHDAVHQARQIAVAEGATPAVLQRAGIRTSQDGNRRSVMDLLGTVQTPSPELLKAFPFLEDLAPRVLRQLCNEALYARYQVRQQHEIAALRQTDAIALPVAIDYSTIGGLSAELRTKLAAVRPASLGKATRIEGMTPAALGALTVHARRHGGDVSRET